MTGLRPHRSAVKNPRIQPKKAPAWKVETIFEDRFVSSAVETVSRPKADLKEGRDNVVPMKALS